MYIKKLYLKNIKRYEELEIYFNKNFNLLIGENNIGKTTIFDALLLWKMAYDSLITSDGKNFLKKSNWNSMNITFTKLQMFRIVNAKDIFLDPKKNALISLILSDGVKDFELKIEIQIPGIEDSYIRFKNDSSLTDFRDFARFAQEKKIKLRDIISINITKPLSSITKQEIFYNKAIIDKYSYLGKNYEILRNKIILTMENSKFEYLEEKLFKIFNKKFKIKFKNSKNRENSEYIKIVIQEENNKEVDLSLVGSGIIHILEIFSSLYVKQKYKEGLNILLLDEPDSHIHSSLQSKLIDELKREQERQVFLITHNDRIILKSNISEVLYFSKEKINTQQVNLSNKNEYFKIREDLSNELYKLEKEYWSNVDTTKNTIFVEGLSDKVILEKAFEFFAPKLLDNVKIEEGGGYNFVKNKILSWHYSQTTKKAIGMFDYDNDTLETIKFINKQIGIHKNIKLLKLNDYKPKHIINILQKGIKIPFAIEEMFGIELWKKFEEYNWLEERKEILSYNTELNLGINKTLIQYLNENDINEDLRLFILCKVSRNKKDKVSKYIYENITKDDFRYLEKLVLDIKYYLVGG